MHKNETDGRSIRKILHVCDVWGLRILVARHALITQDLVGVVNSNAEFHLHVRKRPLKLVIHIILTESATHKSARKRGDLHLLQF